MTTATASGWTDYVAALSAAHAPAKRSMRTAMPTVALWIDDLRAAFGADAIDPSIRAGMRGERNRFHAREGDVELGTPFEETRRVEPCL